MIVEPPPYAVENCGQFLHRQILDAIIAVALRHGLHGRKILRPLLRGLTPLPQHTDSGTKKRERPERPYRRGKHQGLTTHLFG